MNEFHQFKTFANSSQNISPTYPDHQSSQQSSRQQLENHQFKSKQFNKKSKKSKENQSNKSQSIRFKYPTDISLMMSDISILGLDHLKDLPLELLNLQVQVTQELLALREDKLTLLEEYNKSLGTRFQIEREIVRLKKKNQEKQRQSIQTGGGEGQFWLNDGNTSPQVTSPASELHPVIIKNKELREQYNQIRRHKKKSSFDSADRQLYEKQMQQIELLQENSRQIENQLSKMEDQFEKINEQRFQTFFPNQKQKKVLNPPSSRNHQELMRLKAERDFLYHQMMKKNPNHEANYFLRELIDENKELQQKADNLLRLKRKSSTFITKKSSIENLRHKIQQEENAKRLFFEDLKKFKQQMQKIKTENSNLARKSYY